MPDKAVGGLPVTTSPLESDSLAGEFDGATGLSTIQNVLALRTIAGSADVDASTQATGKVLTVEASGGKPLSWQTPTSGGGGGSGTLAGLTDVDATTEEIGYSLVYSPEAPVPTIVQKNAGGGSTATLSEAPTAGNLLLLLVSYNGGVTSADVPTGFTDGAQQSGGFSCAMYYKTSVGAADQDVTLPAGYSFAYYEIENAGAPSSFLTSGGTPTAAINALANSLTFAIIAQQPGGTPATGWTSDYSNTCGLMQHIYNAEAVASQEATDSLGSSETYASVIVNIPTVGGTKNYKFVPTAGTTFESLTDVDHNTEHNGYALVALVGSGQYDAAVLATSGLTNYYPFNDPYGSSVAADEVGGLTGAVVGSPNPLGAASISNDGETCYFGNTAGNGGTQSISSGAALPTAAWTIEFVAKISSANASAHFPTIYVTDLGNGGLWFIAQNTSTNAAIIQVNTPGGSIFSNYTYTGSDVVHVMVTYDGSLMKLYINGALDGEITPTQTPAPASTTSYFGSYRENGDYYEGYLAKFAFYNVALPASEAASHYSALTGTQAKTFEFVPVARATVDVVQSYVSSGGNALNGNTFTLPLTATVGNRLVAVLVGGAVSGTPNVSGWSMVTSDSANPSCFIYERIADGTSNDNFGAGENGNGFVFNPWTLLLMELSNSGSPQASIATVAAVTRSGTLTYLTPQIATVGAGLLIAGMVWQQSEGVVYSNVDWDLFYTSTQPDYTQLAQKRIWNAGNSACLFAANDNQNRLGFTLFIPGA